MVTELMVQWALGYASADERTEEFEELLSQLARHANFPRVLAPATPVPVDGPSGFDPSREGWACRGEQVMFLGQNGYEIQLSAALKLWQPGAVLTVSEAHIGDWSSTYRFDGHPGHFNTVMFAQRAEGIEAQSDGTAKQGPARRAKARCGASAQDQPQSNKGEVM